MKKQNYLLLGLSALLFACGSGEEKTKKTTVQLQVKGSDTVLPLTQKLAEYYMKKDSSASITVTGGGSGVGIAALQDGSTDIAMSSRPLKTDEKLKLEEKKKDIREVVIANDALTVIVNLENPVEQLTVSNWKTSSPGK